MKNAQSRRRLLAGTAAATCGLLPLTLLWAAQEQREPEYDVEHAECVYLGPKRARYLRGGATEAARGAAALTALTDQVAQSLPPVPSRSRSGALSSNLTGIDEILFAAQRLNGVPSAELSTDQEFLRRVRLDLTGRIPTGQEVAVFLADPSPNKRAALIDSLLASPEWADKWTMFFGDLFKNSTRTTQVVRYEEGRNAFHRYIKSSLEQNKPYDQMVREMITDNGANSYEQGEINFLIGGFTTGGPVQDTYDTQAAQVAETFLGLGHMNCILCHDGRRHLDTLSLWGSQATRMQAWGMASFLSRTVLTRRPVGTLPQPYYWSVQDNTNRNAADYTLNTMTGNRPPRQPAGGSNRVAPVYLLGGARPGASESYRAALAREVTADFQFARATVNYLWKQFFGIGIVEPPDQFDPLRLDPNNPPPAPWTLQPSNPQLLNRLAQDFVSARYDLKALMRQIANSRAYQLSARWSGAWNPTWDKFYARKLVRRLDAEEIHDALVTASSIPASYSITGLGTVNWAMQLPEPANLPRGPVALFLDSFLRGDRDEEDRSRETSVIQALDLMNDSFVLTRTRATPATSLLGRNLSLSDEQLVQNLFLSVLSRYPTEAERGSALSYLRNGPAAQRTQRAEGLLWSLYNKVDFIFNY